MEEKIFDLNEFVLPTKMFVVKNPTSVPKPKPGPDGFEIVYTDGKDIIIKKRATNTHLVLLFSKELFYLKNEEVILPLSEFSVKDFFDGLNGQDLQVGLSWTKVFSNGANFAAGLISLLSSELFLESVLNDKIAQIDIKQFGKQKESFKDFSNYRDLYKSIFKLATHYFTKEEMEVLVYKYIYGENSYYKSDFYDNFQFTNKVMKDKFMVFKNFFNGVDFKKSVYNVFVDRFGISGFINFCKTIADADFITNANIFDVKYSHYTSIFTDINEEERNFECQRLINYLVFESYSQGYSLVQSRYGTTPFIDFLNEYSDTLKMQEQLFGHIDEKYPKNLSSLHKKLSFLVSLNQQRIDEEEFARRVNILKQNEMSDEGDEYFIKVPNTKEEILDEANQQMNCLSSYVESFTKGNTDLYFMRKQDSPNRSLVSIEVRDGYVRQAYRARNSAITEEQAEFIQKWADKHNIEFHNHFRPLPV